MRRTFMRPAAALPVALLFALAACEAQKSSNPLSPSVAGPIAGVTITAPKLLEPAQGIRFKESQQPIRLLIENASSTGVRPLTYMFEVATDADFQTRVFARSNVPPGDGGRTSVVVDPLDLGRAYYWRAHAEDGANTGLFASAQFEVLPKAQLNPPNALSPINNERVASRRPTLAVGNADKNVAVGSLTYEFQVATDQAFSAMVASGRSDEGNGQTTFDVGTDLAFARQHFWRARATDGETTSGWSTTQLFQTPAAPAPTPGPGPGPGPVGDWTKCGSTPGDAIVSCVHAAVNPSHTAEGAFEVTKRVAWLLRGSGAGLLIKDGGENIVSWMGYSFAAARIVYRDGHLFKLLSDVPTTNGPTWQDEGVDAGLIGRYVSPIDPGR